MLSLSYQQFFTENSVHLLRRSQLLEKGKLFEYFKLCKILLKPQKYFLNYLENLSNGSVMILLRFNYAFIQESIENGARKWKLWKSSLNLKCHFPYQNVSAISNCSNFAVIFIHFSHCKLVLSSILWGFCCNFPGSNLCNSPEKLYFMLTAYVHSKKSKID